METLKRRLCPIILSFAAALLLGQTAYGAQEYSRPLGPGVSCPGCAAGVVRLVTAPAFQVEGLTRQHLTPAFRSLSQWLRSPPGTRFLRTDPSWSLLALMSFEDPGELQGMISVAAVSPLMAAAEPKWKDNVQVEDGKVAELIENVEQLAKDPKSIEKRNAVFEFLGMLRQEARSSVGAEVESFMGHYLQRELPQSREKLQVMLSDVRAVAGFLTQLRLYRYSDQHGKQIDDALAAALRRKQDLEDMLSRDLMAKASRVASGLGESTEEAVEAKTSEKAAEENRLKPSRSGDIRDSGEGVEYEQQGRVYDFGSFSPFSIKGHPDAGLDVLGVVNRESPARIRYDGQSSSKTRGRFFVWVPFIPTGEPIEERGMKKEELSDLEKALQNWIGENPEHRDVLSYKRFVELIRAASQQDRARDGRKGSALWVSLPIAFSLAMGSLGSLAWGSIGLWTLAGLGAVLLVKAGWELFSKEFLGYFRDYAKIAAEGVLGLAFKDGKIDWSASRKAIGFRIFAFGLLAAVVGSLLPAMPLYLPLGLVVSGMLLAPAGPFAFAKLFGVSFERKDPGAYWAALLALVGGTVSNILGIVGLTIQGLKALGLPVMSGLAIALLGSLVILGTKGSRA